MRPTNCFRAGEERFRTLVESIDDVVFRLDSEQRCVDIFGRWLEREGFRPEHFLGRTTRDIVGPAQAALQQLALHLEFAPSAAYPEKALRRQLLGQLLVLLPPLLELRL